MLPLGRTGVGDGVGVGVGLGAGVAAVPGLLDDVVDRELGVVLVELLAPF